MTPTLLVLGRQPALGLAELESLYGTQVRPVGDQAALVGATVEFSRLGGSIKACKLLTVLDTIDWKKIETYLIQKTPEHAAQLPEGKLQLGISVYGLDVTTQRILATGLSVKKAIKKVGKSVRLTPNQSLALSSAQVHHNHLTRANGWELVVVRDGEQTILAQTTDVQDIASYTIRDRMRPKRDARVGMLPPKLAQIIINLATGVPDRELTILDPFCGTGVVLQEAWLMGYEAIGTDIDNRMIDYSTQNLQWLLKKDDISPLQLAVGDATSYSWGAPGAFDAVACETYLGRPFTSVPAPEVLEKNITDCNLIIKKFLQNIAQQVPTGLRMCIAVPAWQVGKNRFKHLPLVDSLSEIGYNRISFEHVGNEQLLYYREDQIVARELLVITRK